MPPRLQDTAASLLHRRLDPISRLIVIFVFPHPFDLPPSRHERLIDSSIAINIGLELRHPVVLVRPWNAYMGRARVPETAIYEHRDFPAGEHQVAAHSDTVVPDQEILAEPESTTVQF
jgi:hypothetical protein